MRQDEFARRRRLLMRHMGREAIAILPAAPVRMRNNDVEYHYRPDSDFYYLTAFAEPEAVAVLIPGPAAGGVRAVRARPRPGARGLGRRPGGARRRGPGLRRRRRLPDRRHRRDPAGPDRAPLARVLHHGRASGVRQARDRLGQPAAFPGQARHAHAARIRDPRPPAARDAPHQEPGRARLHAPLGADRLRRAPARRRGGAAGPHGVRGDGGDPARVPSPPRRHLLLPDRRQRAECLRAALPREQPPDAGRRTAADRRGLRVRLLRLRRDAHASRRRPLQPQAARGLRGGAGGAAGRDREGPRRGALERAARGGGARHHAGARAPRPAEGARAEADQGRRLPPVLHAPRRPLARHGRARRRRVQGRRAVAAAGAGHGHHHRARHLHRPGQQGRARANGGASACASRTTSSSPTASRKS